MPENIGRNRNTNDVARVEQLTILSTQSSKIADVNAKRIFFNVSLDADTDTVDLIIRLYPNGDDNDKRGITLTRRLAGNDSMFNLTWTMPTDNIYTGEISAISVAGDIAITVTEY